MREPDCHDAVAGEFGHNDFYPVVMAAAQAVEIYLRSVTHEPYFQWKQNLGATLLHPSGQIYKTLFVLKDIAMSEHFHGRHQLTESLKRF